jgi:hypothetical protein
MSFFQEFTVPLGTLIGDRDRPAAITVQTVSSQGFNTAPAVIEISWDQDHKGTIDGAIAAASKHPSYVPESAGNRRASSIPECLSELYRARLPRSP